LGEERSNPRRCPLRVRALAIHPLDPLHPCESVLLFLLSRFKNQLIPFASPAKGRGGIAASSTQINASSKFSLQLFIPFIPVNPFCFSCLPDSKIQFIPVYPVRFLPFSFFRVPT
jgi:hypothetical protein